MMKKITFLLFALFCAVFYADSLILINEYSGANYDTYTDNYGEYEDWIELYNPSPNDVDLNGWFLTDKTNNPTKWMFPSSFVVPS